jgi:class I lanthipeptide synthase
MLGPRDGRLRAEVVYAPERPRSANVAVQPATQLLEVVVGVPPGVPEDQVVTIEELSVDLTGSG